MLLGVDTGGTFTDFVLFEDGRLRIHKVLSTPHAPEEAILQGVRDLGLSADGLAMVHGSTVATNAVLEGKGVRTAYITNRGLADVLTIGRQARRSLYDLQPQPLAPPVPEDLCLETGGRLAADGTPLEPLTPEDLDRLLARIAELKPEAVAINLLFSFLDDAAERAVAAALPADLFVSRSSDVLPEYREYERGIATWLNAWVGPLVEGYLGRLRAGVAPAPVAVMQSSGGTVSADQAGRGAVRLLLSGPAGGLAGARFVGESAGAPRLLTFDMGGTSTDVALIDGDLRLTSEGHIGPYPVAVPMVDMHTIGAGGGSIARVDAGGLLQVGPESAGAAPGPACYGQGGREATVTDANLVLGRLRPDAFLGGAMALDPGAARQAVGRVAADLGVGVEQAALGIIALANEHMAAALRVISVQRGEDPRDYALASFGGAGGLHVCALADALGMDRALVPIHAGVLSAVGMLVAPRSRELSRTRQGLLDAFEDDVLDTELQALAASGRESLGEEGVAPEAVEVGFSLDLRYLGQSYTLNLPWEGVAGTGAAFHRRHEARYGHRLDQPVELVNLRAGLQAAGTGLWLDPVAVEGGRETRDRVELVGIEGTAPVWPRDDLAAGQTIQGPALITETVSTTYLAPGWQATVDVRGSLLLERVSA